MHVHLVYLRALRNALGVRLACAWVLEGFIDSALIVLFCCYWCTTFLLSSAVTQFPALLLAAQTHLAYISLHKNVVTCTHESAHLLMRTEMPHGHMSISSTPTRECWAQHSNLPRVVPHHQRRSHLVLRESPCLSHALTPWAAPSSSSLARYFHRAGLHHRTLFILNLHLRRRRSCFFTATRRHCQSPFILELQ